MARVKVCVVCEHQNAPGEMFCVGEVDGEICGSSLANIDVTEAVDRSAAEQSNVAVAPVSMTTREPTQRSARVCFPWGEEQVSGLLGIGRDPEFSRLWQRLDSYPTVSGRHAELRLLDGGVCVLHLGGTNPTYVDGRALTAGESAIVGDGCQVAFSRMLVATVRIGNE